MRGERGNRLLRGADRWLGIPLTAPAACWRKLSHASSFSGKPEKIGIFCPGAVGDLLLLSALTDALRSRFPDCRLELLASEANAGALPLNPHVEVRKAWPLGRPDKILAYIRASKYDVFIDSSQWARLGNLLANLSGAAVTIGFATKGQFRSLGYDHLCQHSADLHEIENFLNLGRTLWPEIAGSPSVAVPRKTPQAPLGPVIYCHMWPAPGRGRTFKEWPPEYWASLIDRLLSSGYAVRLTGSGEDRPACEDFIKRHFPAVPGVESIAGCTTWTELAVLFSEANAVVSVNTGAMHLAAMAGAPTIGLHGATNPKRWGPVGPAAISLLPAAGDFSYLNLGFEYPRKARPAMHHLKVEAVLDALREFGITV